MTRSVPDPALDAKLNALRRFRSDLYRCFTGWRDTLFEMTDAVLVSPQRMESLPWLSLEAPMRRGHGSIYRALERGGCDPTALADLFSGLVTGFVEPDLPLVFSLDCSHWPRRDAATSPDRTFNYDASKDRYHDHGAPVTAGWWYQWLTATTWGHSSWVLPMDLARIAVGDNHHTVAVTQIRALLHRLTTTLTTADPADPTQTPIVCVDGDYSVAWISRQLVGQPVQLLGRLRSDAALFTAPAPRAPGARGRQSTRGPKMKLSNPTTWPEPDQVRIIPARPDHGRTHELSVIAWHGLQPGFSRKLPESHPGAGRTRDVLRGNLIRIHSTKPGQKPMWLLWTGPPGSFDLDIAWRAYLHRFDIEHLFRFCKQHLGWTTPRVRTPDQATLWTWLIAAAYAHLIIARDLITDHRLPWEHTRSLSPLRVKRGFRALHPHLGTPTRTPQKARPGPGRPPGRTSTPAPRHPITRKHPQPNTRNKKQATTTATARPTARTG